MKDGISVAFMMGDDERCVALNMAFDGRMVFTQFPPEYARDLASRLMTAADACDEHCEEYGSDEDESTEPPADASGESVLPPGPDPQPPGL